MLRSKVTDHEPSNLFEIAQHRGGTGRPKGVHVVIDDIDDTERHGASNGKQDVLLDRYRDAIHSGRAGYRHVQRLIAYPAYRLAADKLHLAHASGESFLNTGAECASRVRLEDHSDSSLVLRSFIVAEPGATEFDGNDRRRWAGWIGGLIGFAEREELPTLRHGSDRYRGRLTLGRCRRRGGSGSAAGRCPGAAGAAGSNSQTDRYQQHQ